MQKDFLFHLLDNSGENKKNTLVYEKLSMKNMYLNVKTNNKLPKCILEEIQNAR